MKCEEVMELMQRDLDHDLSEGEQDDLRRHLAGCPECLTIYERLRALSDSLENLPQVVPPVSLVDAILPQLQGITEGDEAAAYERTHAVGGKERKFPVSKWLPFAAAAAFLVVLLPVFMSLFGSGGPEGELAGPSRDVVREQANESRQLDGGATPKERETAFTGQPEKGAEKGRSGGAIQEQAVQERDAVPEEGERSAPAPSAKKREDRPAPATGIVLEKDRGIASHGEKPTGNGKTGDEPSASETVPGSVIREKAADSTREQGTGPRMSVAMQAEENMGAAGFSGESAEPSGPAGPSPGADGGDEIVVSPKAAQDTSAQQDRLEAAPPFGATAMGISPWHSGQREEKKALSPSGEFIAQVEENRIVVKERAGQREVYVSRSWERQRPVKIEWLDDRLLTYAFLDPPHETWMIDLQSKTERKK